MHYEVSSGEGIAVFGDPLSVNAKDTNQGVIPEMTYGSHSEHVNCRAFPDPEGSYPREYGVSATRSSQSGSTRKATNATNLLDCVYRFVNLHLRRFGL